MSTLSSGTRVSLYCDDLARCRVGPRVDSGLGVLLTGCHWNPIGPKWDPWRVASSKTVGLSGGRLVLGGRPWGAYAPRSATRTSHETAKFESGIGPSRFCTIFPGA